MEIEIAVAGESSKWILSQPFIRIGQDPRCEVNLSGGRYPAVASEHTALEVADGAVRLVKGTRPGAETLLNGRPAAAGALLRSGDLLRLGAAGPELRIRLLEAEAALRSTAYEATRMIDQPTAGAATHEATRMVNGPSRTAHEPTRMISGSGAAAFAPAQPPPANATGRQSHATQAVTGPPAATALPRRPEAGAKAGTAPLSYRPSRGQESTGQTNAAQAAARAAESETMQTLAAKLNTMRMILAVNLLLLLGLFAYIYVQGRELAQTHREVQQLRAQAQSAVGTLMPTLDQRLNVFEKRMDLMDAKVASAQDRLVNGMDTQAKAAEDHLVERMNTEIPAMMDKYVAKTKADLMQH
ncbi:MAG: FHA domain-containing protein [Terracidiphilus sp.]|jgi:cell division protein FtsB